MIASRYTISYIIKSSAFISTALAMAFCCCRKISSSIIHTLINNNNRHFSHNTRKTSVVPDIRKLNKNISHLIRTGRLNDARTLFDTLTYRNTVTWNSMITGYVKNRQIVKARNLFDEMPDRDKDVVSWNLIISGYLSCRYYEQARNVFDEMPERDRDFVTWNTMISGYAKAGRMGEALQLFDEMPVKNVVSWNAVISGFCCNGDVKAGVEYFKKMPERDSASLGALLSGLIKNEELDEAENVLNAFGEGSDGDDLVYAYNTLIAGYGQKGRVDDARRLFDKMTERNVVSWNSMIMGYIKAGDVGSARQLFDQMTERDTFSWNTMISGYVHASNMDEASNLFSKMPKPDVLSWNSIISGYAQAGKLELARDYFVRMPQKNRISWNSMISACERNADYEGAIKVFREMQQAGEKPDRHTLSSLLSVCAESVALFLGMQIHQLVAKTVIPDIPLNNSLITMYARCGGILEARTIFDKMKFQKDVISWNAMVGGYASHGFAFEALELFELMKRFKVRPTHITFISVLNACAHAGLVEQGRLYFKSMESEFGIKPEVEHFASLVDIVGRHGQLEEAMEVINNMPVEPDNAVWGALLGACRVHNNIELARIAAEVLMRLEPESSGPYVLLYNMYADAGRWDDANEIRMLMETNNIRKEAAYSRVGSRSS